MPDLQTNARQQAGYIFPLVNDESYQLNLKKHDNSNTSFTEFEASNCDLTKSISIIDEPTLDEALLNKSVFKHLNHLYGIILD